ncbi:MAG: methyltransferase-like protein, partial [Sediminibacterium sp.]|nr:methyltransferase-like protein [Sediminibacterium sp.]
SMVYAYPVPDEVALQEYNADYFDNAHGGMQTHPLTVAFHSAINLLRVVHVELFQKNYNSRINSVLEIGPGGGHFARHWLKRNPNTGQYTGVESDSSCHENLSKTGIEVFSNVDQLPAGKKFDLVVISHVLEHTSDPAAFLLYCTRQLAPGGILFIEVPCNDYEHKELDEPHLLFFDKQPMDRLLNRVGFDKVKLSYHGNTISDLSKKISFLQKTVNRAKNFLLGRGFTGLFSAREKGMEEMDNALERAVIKPFKAHIEQNTASWWLRAVAIKK